MDGNRHSNSHPNRSPRYQVSAIKSFAGPNGISEEPQGGKIKMKDHWVDTLHKEDGGADEFGRRPQGGSKLLQQALQVLSNT